MILCRALGLGVDRLLALGQDYASVSVLGGSGERWTLRVLNHCEDPDLLALPPFDIHAPAK